MCVPSVKQSNRNSVPPAALAGPRILRGSSLLKSKYQHPGVVYH